MICDATKIDGRGCVGAPDLIVEILSPGNSAKDVELKYDVYEEAGVKEYWIVSPVEETISIFILKRGKFGEASLYGEKAVIHSDVVTGLSANVKEIFGK